jgi:hypothetical protein
VRFTDATFTNATFTHASFANVRFTDVRFTNASFTHASFTNVRFTDVRFTNASFTNASFDNASFDNARFSDVRFDGIETKSVRFLSSLYKYRQWALLAKNGTRYVRMGCLFHTLDEWEKIGIRKSNLKEFPDDGSDESEERVAAFEFAKQAALRLK